MSLNNLLRYRFTKKAGEKLDHSDSQDGGDSQSTVQNGSQPTTQDSQATLDPNVVPESPHSPLSQNGFGFLDDEDLPNKDGVVELDSESPQKPNGKFRRIVRPIDSDDSQDVSITASTDGTSDILPRLQAMFPNASDNRLRAAVILHANNFTKAVEFVTSDPSRKRPLDQNGSTTPEKTFKRIKMAPQSPTSPAHPIVVGTDFLDEPPHTQKSLEFLRGCFPALPLDELKTALAGNNGDAALTCAQLTSAHGGAPHNNNGAGPSKPNSNISTLSNTRRPGGGKKGKKAKRKNVDVSDESEDDYDDYSGDSDDSDDLDNRSKSETDTFLEFFEEATIEELTAMPGCSKKKADLIMNLRPFKSWETLYEKISAEKHLTLSIITGCKEVMQVRNTVRRLMVRCENISHEMGLVVQRLTQAKGATGRQPTLLTKELTLQPYQLIGVGWLKVMHEQELNGILADEMGLGKTIQAIAFLAQLKEHGEEGPHVIIVPSSTIENWLRELQKWCPDLKVIVYYGSQDERRAVRHSIFFQGEEFNVLLTTYNMATGAAEDRVLFKKFEFHYAVFDEGHMLKNMSSLRFQNLMKISAERRLLLTGTPLQNNLLELMSLLCFVMPEIFQGKTDHLKKVFTMISRHDEKKKSRFERDRIAHAKRIMKPFVLRRLKKDVLSQLPPKTEHMERCSMLPAQQELYDSLLTRYACEVTDKEEGGGANKSVGIFMQFRKAANHPLLLRRLYTDTMLTQMAKNMSREPSHRDRGALPKLIEEDMGVMNDFELLRLCKNHKKYLSDFILDPSVISESGKFRVLDRLLPEMKEREDRVLLFSQFTMMLDVMEVYMEAKGYKYLRLDGQTPVPDRLQLIDKFNNNPDIFIFLLSTRAGGLGINLTAANTIILHDIDFNPYNDKQAEDRCHRLGQKKEVHIVRMICEGTVDEVMLRCANSKLALERDLAECDTGTEGQEETKDVANMLKEVFKTANQRRANTQNTSLNTSS